MIVELAYLKVQRLSVLVRREPEVPCHPAEMKVYGISHYTDGPLLMMYPTDGIDSPLRGDLISLIQVRKNLSDG